jgi:2-oxoglutarate ferredoxin oxidoreductase subunit delta
MPEAYPQIDRETINQKGHSPATLTDESACTGCGSCATMCPDCVITVEGKETGSVRESTDEGE